MIFEIFKNIGNYESRKVARDEFPWGFISTARMLDAVRKPFETAVVHEDYRNGEHVIVECYDTQEEAAAGHAKWLATMTADALPESLTDCQNSEVQQTVAELSGESLTFHRKPKVPA